MSEKPLSPSNIARTLLLVGCALISILGLVPIINKNDLSWAALCLGFVLVAIGTFGLTVHLNLKTPKRAGVAAAALLLGGSFIVYFFMPNQIISWIAAILSAILAILGWTFSGDYNLLPEWRP
jgi:FtsH-binding integral membrane protein